VVQFELGAPLECADLSALWPKRCQGTALQGGRSLQTEPVPNCELLLIDLKSNSDTAVSPLLLDPGGNVVHNVFGNIARANVVGVSCRTSAFEEEVIELGIALKGSVGAFG
jgi:hypothetical protein